MNRRTYTAEEIISYYVPSDIPPNFSSFGPVGTNRPDFRPLRMNNLYNITNITNVNNNKYDNDGQFVPIARSNSEQTANWEPHIIPQKSPLATFSSSNNINNIQKHQASISPPDQNTQAFGSNTYQPDFPSVLTPSSNEQAPLSDQQQQPQLQQQASSLPPNPQIPQQTQQQPPQYPFMYLHPTQFYPFVNSAQPFAVYSQYPQPQFTPGYGRPPPQSPFSQRFAYVNQPVMPQLLQTDQMNMGIPPQPQPQPRLQPQPPQQAHSMDLSFNPMPLSSQFQTQQSQQQGVDLDQNQFNQPPQGNTQVIPNVNEYDDSEDPAMLMKYEFAFPSIVPQSPEDEESFGSVLHPQQQEPQQSVDKPFNPTPISYGSDMNDIQQQSQSQQQSGSNDSLVFPSVIQEQDEFSPVIGPGFQQNPPSSFPSVMQQDANEPSFPSFVSPSQQPSTSPVNQSSIDSGALDSGFSSVINNSDQTLQQGFPSIIDNQQPFASPQMPNQSFNSMFSGNNSGFPSVVSQQQPQQIQSPQQIPNAPDNMGAPSFNPISIDAPQFQPQGFDNSGFPSIFEVSKPDEFSSVIKPQPQQPQQQTTQKQQVPQIEPTVYTFLPKKSFAVSSSVPPKDSFNPQPIATHQSQPQSQPQARHPPLKPPTLEQPPPNLQIPSLQQPPTLQQPTLQQAPQLENKPAIETPTFQPRRILDPLHSKSNQLIRSKSTPIRNDQSIMPNILSGVPQFQPQPQPQLQMPPPQLQQPPQQTMQPVLQPQQGPVFHPQPQPQIHDQIYRDQILQDAKENQKDGTTDSSMKKFQPKPFNAIEVEEQKRPDFASIDQNQQPPLQQRQPQQNQPQRQRQPKKIRKRDLPGQPFDPKPIAQQFYYSPTPTPDINIAIKPRKDTFIGRRRVW